MCLFPMQNFNRKSKAYLKGVTQFDCGICPECLSKKANQWALRCSYEAKNKPSMMLTLTYDTYIYDENGNIIGEEVSDKSVDKKDVQLFIKRLRAFISYPYIQAFNKWKKAYLLDKFPKNNFKSLATRREIIGLYCKNNSLFFEEKKTEFLSQCPKIKYLASAEYGKTTGRPHYHVLIFNYQFNDCIPYKKSKRGNLIYKSVSLGKIWKNGICSVDSLVTGSSVARYCTKYCAKDAGANDTFMLMSQKIGLENLYSDFNGKSYIVDGREYPIPRIVWNRYIEDKYSYLPYTVSARYVNRRYDKDGYFCNEHDFEISKLNRINFLSIRDNDPIYNKYILYWQEKSKINEFFKGSEYERINNLDNKRYFHYKMRALDCFNRRKNSESAVIVPPRDKMRRYGRKCMEDFFYDCKKIGIQLPFPPCHYKATDRKKRIVFLKYTENLPESPVLTEIFLKNA